MKPPAGPRVAGVMGWPVSHSLSPLLHGTWLDAMGIAGYYAPLAVRPEALADAITALPAMGFSGVNITIPHKEAALRLLDRVEPLARRIGAVNTIVVDDKGKLKGMNTDAYGFLAHLEASVPGWQAGDGAALIVGAGGAARAAAVALLDAGVPDVMIVNRSVPRAEALARDLDDRRVRVMGWADRSAAVKDARLTVNTTSLGMAGQPRLDLELSLAPAEAIVYDIVYVPRETDLLRRARAHGLIAIDGLGMLVHQAVPAFEAFFGQRPQVDAGVFETLEAALAGSTA